MPFDQINLSGEAAEGIGLALDQDFQRAETPERMAWVVLLLKHVADEKDFFPKGKWATIQSIEAQLFKAAEYWRYSLKEVKR